MCVIYLVNPLAYCIGMVGIFVAGTICIYAGTHGPEKTLDMALYHLRELITDLEELRVKKISVVEDKV